MTTIIVITILLQPLVAEFRFFAAPEWFALEKG